MVRIGIVIVAAVVVVVGVCMWQAEPISLSSSEPATRGRATFVSSSSGDSRAVVANAPERMTLEGRASIGRHPAVGARVMVLDAFGEDGTLQLPCPCGSGLQSTPLFAGCPQCPELVSLLAALLEAGEAEVPVLAESRVGANGELDIAGLPERMLAVWVEDDAGAGFAHGIPGGTPVRVELAPWEQMRGLVFAGDTEVHVAAMHPLTGRVWRADVEAEGYELLCPRGAQLFVVAWAEGRLPHLQLAHCDGTEVGSAELEKSHTLEGRVTGPTGAPAVSAVVTVLATDWMVEERTDADGRFRVTEIRPFDCSYAGLTVTAEQDGALAIAEEVVCGPDDDPVQLRLGTEGHVGLVATVASLNVAPLVGAQVRARTVEGAGADASALGDPARAALTLLPRREYDLVVTAPGHARTCAEVVTGASGGQLELEVVLRPAFDVRGRVVNEDGDPVTDVMVWLQPLCDADGNCSSDDDDDDEGKAFGDYFDDEGISGEEYGDDYDEDYDEDYEDYDDYEDDYDELAGMVSVENCAQRPMPPRTGGAFVFTEVPGGRYRLFAARDDLILEETEIVASDAEVVLVLPGAGQISGVVVDSEGAPVERIEVELQHVSELEHEDRETSDAEMATALAEVQSGRHCYGLGEPIKKAFTGVDGGFVFPGLSHCPFLLVVRRETVSGYAQVVHDGVVVRASDPTHELELILPRLVTTQGEVRDDQGALVGDGIVHLSEVSDSLCMFSPIMLPVENGTFAVDGVPPGRYEAEPVVEGWFAHPQTVEVGGELVSLTVTRGRSVTGAVVDADSGQSLTALIGFHDASSSRDCVVTDSSGRFELSEISPFGVTIHAVAGTGNLAGLCEQIQRTTVSGLPEDVFLQGTGSRVVEPEEHNVTITVELDPNLDAHARE